MRLYSESEKSTFSYWFAHWYAYQKTAIKLNSWKFKYLFHDIEKPWLMLLWNDYPRVRNWHRTHNRHHLTYSGSSPHDWEAMVIDWECSRLSKKDAQMNARETMEYECKKYPNMSSEIRRNILPILYRLGL